jgi:hypothetical protein
VEEEGELLIFSNNLSKCVRTKLGYNKAEVVNIVVDAKRIFLPA